MSREDRRSGGTPPPSPGEVPPPFDPHRELITYIERAQRPSRIARHDPDIITDLEKAQDPYAEGPYKRFTWRWLRHLLGW